MRKHSILSAIITYILIVFFIIGINIILYIPINQLQDSANILQQNYEIEKDNINLDENSQNVDQFYTEYILQVQDHYVEFGRVFTNMIVALLLFLSLALVIVGLSLRVNANRNKGIYNAIILSGLTCIFYLIWFSINITNAFEMLF